LTISSFRDSPAKRIVRERWNTTFLRYLHTKFGFRYRYMGFPGTDLDDVKLWKDMIDEVIAFELPSPGLNDRLWITQLRANLKRLDIPGVAYLGSFEEVVVLRRDHDGQLYKQDKVITLYNLDFCDEIASKVDTLELGRKQWRFEALRIILQDQKQCYLNNGGPCHFVILLTVRNQITAAKIRKFLKNNLLEETHSYCENCSGSNPIPSRGPLIGSHAWSLKAFLYNTLRYYFGAPNICALFFPIIKYTGTPVRLDTGDFFTSPMLHWMMFCQFGEPESPTPRFHPSQFLSQVTSLRIKGSGIVLDPEPGEIVSSSQQLSPVEWFQPFKAFFFTNGGVNTS
jgi:hypothetical protein